LERGRRNAGGAIAVNRDVAPELLGDSAVMRQLRQQIARVACLTLTVLVEGQRGTGKKLVARAIHEASGRRDGSFVEFVCAELDPLTAASTFFGHRRGTFGGATRDRTGVFEAAHRGTLLLHHIDELPLGVQAQLLRVVEEGAIRRVGETQVSPVEVRLIATTNRNLPADVKAGRFREDLLYRIGVVRIEVPGLDARREDIPFLADTFRHRASLMYDRRVHTISLEAVEHLMSRAWPGNIAELRAAIESAVFRCTGTVLEPTDFPPDVPALAI
jgi:DNA-binding NtrC family response regulator